MKRLNTRSMVICAMVAAVYTVLCVAFAPISYGMLQIRVAEVLTLLPLFNPIFIWGVTLGCALSNFIGFMMGTNILGFMDIIFGTSATFLAAWLSYWLRNVRVGKIPVLSAAPPVLLNALIIGLELMWMEMGAFVPEVFLINGAYVGLGQAVACFAMGLPLIYILEKTGVSRLFVTAGDSRRLSGPDPA